MNLLERIPKWLLSLLPLFLVGALGARFWYQDVQNPLLTLYTFPWKAHYIKAPTADPGVTCFRKTFTLQGRPPSALLVVSADNFFSVLVNGRRPFGFFRPAGALTGFDRPTSLYSAMGFHHHAALATVYDMAPLLVPGVNCITVKTDSDEGPPKVALQAEITGPERQTIVTDGTWFTSPTEVVRDQIDWTMRSFQPDGWMHAQVDPTPVTALVDGDLAVYTAPITGDFVADARLDPTSTYVFRKEFDASPPADSTTSMRICTYSAYDIRINGLLVGGSTVTQTSPLTVFPDMHYPDQLPRLTRFNRTERLPGIKVVQSYHGFATKNILRSGKNLVEVTLHPTLDPLSTFKPQLFFQLITEDTKGNPVQSLASDETWQVRRIPSDTYRPVEVIGSAQTIGFHHARLVFRGNAIGRLLTARWVARAAIIVVGLDLLLCILLLILIHGMGITLDKLFSLVGTIHVAPLVFLTTGTLIQVLYADASQRSYVSSVEFAQSVIYWSFGVTAVSLLLYAIVAKFAGVDRWIRRKAVSLHTAFTQSTRSTVSLILLAVISVSAMVYYYQGVAFQNYQPDEYVSILAAQGILKTGLPKYLVTGIYYTRSSLFHYLLAAAMFVGGPKNPYALRFWPALFLVGTAIVSYFLARRLGGRFAALIAAIAVAFCPYTVFFAHEVRFYTQFAFFTTLCAYFFIASLQEPGKNSLRIYTVLAFCGAYLSQEFAISILFATFGAILITKQTRQWFNLRMLPWLVLAFLVIGIDYAAYLAYCQTPLPFVDRDAIPLLALHVKNMEVLAMYLAANFEESMMVAGLLCIIGTVYAIFRLARSSREDRENKFLTKWWCLLLIYVIPLVAFSAMITPKPAVRYIVQAAPLVFVMAACVFVLGVRFTLLWVGRLSGTRTYGWITCGACTLCVAGLWGLSYKPIRTLNASTRYLNRDFTGASRYVAERMQPGDKIMYFCPEAAIVELGKCDYMWRPRLGSVYRYYSQDRVMRDRNAGAITVDSPEKLEDVMDGSSRVWLVLPSDIVGTANTINLRDMKYIVWSSFTLARETFGIKVYLWDRTQNGFHGLRNHGLDTFGFQLAGGNVPPPLQYTPPQS